MNSHIKNSPVIIFYYNLLKIDIWVKVKGQKAKTPHCVWPSFCAGSSRPDINWASLTDHQVTFPHIRLYELSAEDSLSTLVSFLEQFSSIPATMGIIVINTVDSYELDAKYFTTEQKETPVPVVVVKRKTGEALLKEIKSMERRERLRLESRERRERRRGRRRRGERKAATMDRVKKKKKFDWVPLPRRSTTLERET